MKRTRILVIDDSATILTRAQLTLEGAGYEVMTTRETFGFPALVSRFRPHLVLVDVKVGKGVDGTALIKNLRMRPVNGAAVAMILYSSQRALENLAHNCGADGFIKKSADLDLAKEVGTHLRAARCHRSTSP